MVKGLAKSGNRLRHGRQTKHVDASPFCLEGRLLPNDGAMLHQTACRRQRANSQRFIFFSQSLATLCAA